MLDTAPFVKEMVGSVKRAITKALEPVVVRIDELAAKAAALESRLTALPAPAKGDIGPSAFEIAFAHGFKGTEREWLESLRGKDAETGDVARLVADAVALMPKAKDGENAEIDYDRISKMLTAMVGVAVLALPEPKPGRDAEPIDPVDIERAVAAAVSAIPKPKDAEPVDYERVAEMVKTATADGKPIHPDTVALMVAGEVSKAMERALASIPAPKDGDPGRDALQIDILPAIDEAKNYPRGTFARYRGGLIQAFRGTSPIEKEIELAGWSVIVQGLADISIDTADDLRSAVIAVRKTGGEVVEHRMTLPVVIDRGVYREGDDYAKGDGVTWGGSFWIAQRDTSSKPDAADGGWRLAIKRGRDGKDSPARK